LSLGHLKRSGGTARRQKIFRETEKYKFGAAHLETDTVEPETARLKTQKVTNLTPKSKNRTANQRGPIQKGTDSTAELHS